MTEQYSLKISEKSQKQKKQKKNRKWNQMIINFEEFYKSNYSKVKKRTRKGVPDCLRGYIWSIFGSVPKYIELNKDLYVKLSKENISQLEEASIQKDIGRTFPKHYLFKEENQEG